MLTKLVKSTSKMLIKLVSDKGISPTVSRLSSTKFYSKEKRIVNKGNYSFSTRIYPKTPADSFNRIAAQIESDYQIKDFPSNFLELIKEKALSDKNVKYSYNDKAIFSTSKDFIQKQDELFKTSIRQTALRQLSSQLKSDYVNPWASLVFLSVFLQDLKDNTTVSQIAQTSITIVELINSTHVKLYTYLGEEIVCKINNFEALEFEKINFGETTKDNESTIITHVLKARVKDVKGEVHPEIHFWLDSEQTCIENMDLFKAVLNGRTKEVRKFKLQL